MADRPLFTIGYCTTSGTNWRPFAASVIVTAVLTPFGLITFTSTERPSWVVAASFEPLIRNESFGTEKMFICDVSGSSAARVTDVLVNAVRDLNICFASAIFSATWALERAGEFDKAVLVVS